MLEEFRVALCEERAVARSEHEALMAECRLLQTALHKLAGVARVAETDSNMENTERGVEDLQVIRRPFSGVTGAEPWGLG